MTSNQCVYCGRENGKHNEVCVLADNKRLRAERDDALEILAMVLPGPRPWPTESIPAKLRIYREVALDKGRAVETSSESERLALEFRLASQQAAQLRDDRDQLRMRHQEAFRIINAATYYVPQPRQLHAEMVAWLNGASTQEASPEEPTVSTESDCSTGVGGVTLVQMAENIKLGLDPYTGSETPAEQKPARGYGSGGYVEPWEKSPEEPTPPHPGPSIEKAFATSDTQPNTTMMCSPSVLSVIGADVANVRS